MALNEWSVKQNNGNRVHVYHGNESAEDIYLRLIRGRRGLIPSDFEVRGRGGNDVLHGYERDRPDREIDEDIKLYGEKGDDDLRGGVNDDQLYGGLGNDKLYGNKGRDFLYGNEGKDLLYGEDGHDYLNGGVGSDTLWGGSGDDELFGKEGNDRILGESGNDRLKGGEGNDILSDSQGNDHLDGGTGADMVFGGAGNDELFGRDGIDKLDGQSGDDYLSGGSDDDRLKGGEGHDVLKGGVGNDDLSGGEGHDVLKGGVGNDDLSGGEGNDTLYGGAFAFQSASAVLDNFNAGSGDWPSFNDYPRQLADVNGDGRADIVGFGDDAVYVSLAQSDGTFENATIAFDSNFTINDGGWSSFNDYPRQLADINGDGRNDVVAFGANDVAVALAQADGTFGDAQNALSNNFTVNDGGWSSFDKYPRQLADVNGDGRADIVGFGGSTVRVALAQANGTFENAKVTLDNNFTVNDGGWSSFDKYPRQLADVNGDGRADIVGFGDDAVYVSLAQGDGTFENATIAFDSNFTINDGGWSSFNDYPRQLADINGDGRNDVVAFGANDVAVALAQADGTFGDAQNALSNNFTVNDGGWSSFDEYPRQLADVNGDGRVDIVGFGDNDVYVSLNSTKSDVVSDTLDGGLGDDELFGEIGDDKLQGGSGNDILDGGEGDDQLYGGIGNDVLKGNSGNDYLDGGEGNDVAAFDGTPYDYDLTYNDDDTVNVEGFGNTDTLNSIEVLEYGNYFNSTDPNSQVLQVTAGVHATGDTSAKPISVSSYADQATIFSIDVANETGIDLAFDTSRLANFINDITLPDQDIENSRMLSNVLLDVYAGGLGAIPVVGSVASIGAAVGQTLFNYGADQAQINAQLDAASDAVKNPNYGVENWINVEETSRDLIIIDDFQIGVDSISLLTQELNPNVSYAVKSGSNSGRNGVFIEAEINDESSNLVFVVNNYGSTNESNTEFLDDITNLISASLIGTFNQVAIDITPSSNGKQIGEGTFASDFLFGEELSSREFNGENGNFELIGEFGDDVIVGNKGDDVLWGGFNTDQYISRFENDKIVYEEDGYDILEGGIGNDKLYGGTGNDILNGGGFQRSPGGDILTNRDGESGSNLLVNDGADILTGGAGSDTFVFNTRSTEIDIIRDFESGVDHIEIGRDFADFVGSSNSEFMYNSASGALSFDGQQFATLGNLPNSFDINTDIVIV